MLAILLIAFLVAGLAPLLHAPLGRRTGWVLALLPLGIFAYFLTFVPRVSQGEAVVHLTPWISSLQINLSFYLDGLSLLFALLISGIGALVLVYGGGYLEGDRYLGRFYLYILLFMASMLGLVLASNLITLFVFWELTSLTSYLLIGYKHQSEKARKAALQALLVTGIGGLALLAGLILLGFMAGTFELHELLAAPTPLQEHPAYLGALVLILVGAFTKSAQFPFHFWLPGAMAAPTPVSAYLHSATMVKAGVYLLARLAPAMGGTEVWLYAVAGFGLVTAFVGSYLALCYTDLKLMLAYTTVAALGTLTFLIGLGTPEAAKAMAVFLLAHALYKAALFMGAGSVEHGSGSRDVSQLAGLGPLMPLSFAAALLAAASMAGLPPLLGFIGKEVVYESVLHQAPSLLLVALVVAKVAVVAVALLVGLKPFVGSLRAPLGQKVHEVSASMWLPPLLLALLGLGFGLFPKPVEPLLVPAAGAVLGEAVAFYLALWHGLNLVLLLSLLTLLAGVLLYWLWERLGPALRVYERLFARLPERGYELSLEAMSALAAFQTRALQSGRMPRYLLLILSFTLLLVGSTLFLREGLVGRLDLAGFSVFEWALALLVLVGSLVVATTGSRLMAVAALGVVGYAVALIFLVYGAIDVAITQIAVETLTVILLVLVLRALPKGGLDVNPRGRWRDAALAVAFGALMTALVLGVTSLPFDTRLSEWFAEASYPLARGRNIVNVILVDFRALDTLGEILVLVTAAVGVYGLLRLRARRKERGGRV
ncbi:putative monovalent cation/H+ antiporter subunit A [Thermus sediminis]|uniref:putative monovalent cation/H+ antiporter subunit A n=1 Tax=Thermus sediminis TaxID=1761908 RepID=UPI000E3C9776|nr:putative monovalent cation/H+ antiporter subunit A [Thermus sediminis]